MNTICGLCGNPLTLMDTAAGENKLADGHLLCNSCLNRAAALNKDVISNLNQFFLAEIRGIILQGKIGVSENTHSSSFQNTGAPTFGFGGTPTRFDEIQDQIVALNARLSILANGEVKELINILERDEKLIAIAEALTIPGKTEGLIFSTYKRVVFIDKKILGNVQIDEYPYHNIRSVDHVESLLYSTLRIISKNGSSAEFRLHNKSDGRKFSSAFSQYLNGYAGQSASQQQQQQQQQRIQASSFDLYNLPDQESPFQQKSSPETSPQNISGEKKESAEVIIQQLEKLGKLKELGVLTEQEFAEQKRKLLERL
ncbi:PH domain-containing protein [uncultured Chryseobacterium sp.]|uniref:PH domain-containing protein n=1 Tax=uncultured Chryseobacterium sp. TaxID=259322 RepID=UPI0025F8A106|nr:PH domain-containing protein [uncultured Chryseobacterium sp.]